MTQAVTTETRDRPRAAAGPASGADLRRGRGARLWRLARGWLVAAALLAAAVVAVQLVAFRTRPIPVRVTLVERGLVEETVSSTKAGAVRSRRVSDLSAEAAGAIAAIHAREGTPVKVGERLISIDRRDPEAALAAAREELHVLGALVEEAEARRKDADRERARLEGLRRNQLISQAEYDRASSLLEVSASALEAARARRDAQTTAIARAEIALAKCDLRAPFDGVVAELFVEAGEWTLPGRVALRFLDPDRLYVRAELDEVDLASVHEGLPARVTLDPYKNRRLAGRVARVAPYVSEAEEQNRTVEVEVELDPGAAAGIDLKHGTSADVELILRKVDGALRIPALALTEGDRVLTIGPDGRARERRVRVGLRNWEWAEVLDGLAEGDAVIVSLESDKVKDGVAVEVAVDAAPR